VAGDTGHCRTGIRNRYGGFECCQRQFDIDLPGDRVAHHFPIAGIKSYCQKRNAAGKANLRVTGISR
jgi:hypothetical protein